MSGSVNLEIVDVRHNPTTDLLFFNIIGGSGYVNLTLRNVQGQAIINKTMVQSNTSYLNLSHLQNGIYLLEAIDIKTNSKAIYRILKN